MEKWKLFMKEVSSDYPFFEYFEKHFKWHKRSCVTAKLPTNPNQPTNIRNPPQEVEKPVFPSPNITPKVNVLEAHISSSSSSRPSSEDEKEKD